METELKVKIPRDELDLPELILEWCKNTCASYITNAGTYDICFDYLYYTFYIGSQEERAFFKLTWGEYML